MKQRQDAAFFRAAYSDVRYANHFMILAEADCVYGAKKAKKA